jgi:hypothetical protein
MIDLGGINYYIDFEALDKLISTDKSLEAQEVTETKTEETFGEDKKCYNTVVTTKVFPKSKEIDGARYDCMGMMLQIIMNTDIEIDDTLGLDRGFAAMPLNWKIAFNTLIKNGVLVAAEEE